MDYIYSKCDDNTGTNNYESVFKEIILPLSSEKNGLKGKKDHLHVNSLFLGHSNDVEEVLKSFNLLKTLLNIPTNIELLQKMIEITKDALDLSHAFNIKCTEENDRFCNQIYIPVAEANISDSQSYKKSPNKQNSVHKGCVIEQLSAQDKGQDQKLKTVLQCTALTIKTVELAKNYLVHLKEDDLYLSGFVESPKLEEFLKYFHIISGSSYSVRRSKSKTKNDPEPEEKPLRKYKPGYLGKGQIKWEKNIGIPSIPYTGVPFTTEGSITYQCVYGPKRTKNCIEHSAENLKNRKRPRESKKKDCPAQIHIRTVHRFPSYNCNSNLLDNTHTTAGSVGYANKCQKAMILRKLREDILNHNVVGEQGFWIRVPLPELHRNHPLALFDKSESGNNEWLDSIP